MEIRPYAQADFEAVLEVVNSLPEWFDGEARNRSIPIDLRFQEAYVAVEGSDIHGFITIYVAEGRLVIGWLGVRKGRQRKGIGRRLLERAERYALENGIEEVATYTLGEGVDYPPYESTRAFYFRNGFEVYRRSQTDSPGCPEEIRVKKRIVRAKSNG